MKKKSGVPKKSEKIPVFLKKNSKKNLGYHKTSEKIPDFLKKTQKKISGYQKNPKQQITMFSDTWPIQNTKKSLPSLNLKGISFVFSNIVAPNMVTLNIVTPNIVALIIIFRG